MKGNKVLEATETLKSFDATSETRKSQYAIPGCEKESGYKQIVCSSSCRDMQ